MNNSFYCKFTGVLSHCHVPCTFASFQSTRRLAQQKWKAVSQILTLKNWYCIKFLTDKICLSKNVFAENVYFFTVVAE